MYRKSFDVMLSLVAGLAIASVGFAADPAMTQRTHSTMPATRHNQQAANPRQAAADRKQPITLAIGGAEESQCASMLTGALKDQGLQVTVRESKGQPNELTAIVPRNLDLSATSKAIKAPGTGQKSAIPPSFDLVLFAPLTKEKAKQAINRLRDLKGVDTQNSHADVSKGELWVRINGAARVTPDDVYNAFHAVGIDAHFSRERSKTT